MLRSCIVRDWSGVSAKSKEGKPAKGDSEAAAEHEAIGMYLGENRMIEEGQIMNCFECQMLQNQIDIMVVLKEHMRLQHGNERAEVLTQRLDNSIKNSVALLREHSK